MCDAAVFIWSFSAIRPLVCLAPVSRYWAYHVSTHAHTYDDTHINNIDTYMSNTQTANTGAALSSSNSTTVPVRHLALIRTFNWTDARLATGASAIHAAHVVHMMSRLTGLHVLHMTADMCDAMHCIAHMTQLHTLEVHQEIQGTLAAHETRTRAMLDALRHLPPTLTSLQLNVDTHAWHGGV